MSFQNFSYSIQGVEPYQFTPYNDNYDYEHSVQTSIDDFGQKISVFSKIAFKSSEGKQYIEGFTHYFLPSGQFYNIDYVISELIHQSFCRQTGYIYASNNYLIKNIPTVHQIYVELTSSDFKRVT